MLCTRIVVIATVLIIVIIFVTIITVHIIVDIIMQCHGRKCGLGALSLSLPAFIVGFTLSPRLCVTLKGINACVSGLLILFVPESWRGHRFLKSESLAGRSSSAVTTQAEHLRPTG